MPWRKCSVMEERLGHLPVRMNSADNAEVPTLSHLQNIESSLLTGPALGAAKSILCLPGRGVLDKAAAMIIGHLLERRGIVTRLGPSGALSMSGLAE
ncbi:MAG: hypothetical protein WBF24_08190 [Xanthobacteraceae bacterium]